jgi:hypothetical protein
MLGNNSTTANQQMSKKITTKGEAGEENEKTIDMTDTSKHTALAHAT